MKIHFTIRLMAVVILLVMGYWIERGITIPDNATKLKLKLRKPTNTEEVVVNINQWTYRMSNEGTYFANPAAMGSGGHYPSGTGISAIYAAGLYIGAKKPGSGGATDTIVVSDVEFSTEFSPGKIVTSHGTDGHGGYRGSVTYNSENTYTDLLVNCRPDNRDSSLYEVYYIQKGVEDNEWTKWKNVPYLPLTADGNPGLIADGQTYAVFNDMDLINQNRVDPQYGPSPGLGLEVELESFAFASGGAANALAHVVFVKISVTNKSTTDWQEAYLGIWADPDIGIEAQKDLVGVDTVAGLGWVYNDPVTGDDAPLITAIGFDFFQGPLVSASDVSADLVARFSENNTRLRYNPDKNKYEVTPKNSGEFTLGLTAITSYHIDDGGPGPPIYFYDKSRYWHMEGKNLFGNPKTGGKYDVERGILPTDQRIVLGAGPFILRSGITQEIWLGIIGGQGTTNDPAMSNSAVAKVRAYDEVAQNAFKSGFSRPRTLDNPTLTVTGVDNKVILTWDNKAECSADMFGEENNIRTGSFYNRDYQKYDFQGYRLYKSLTGIAGSFDTIAVYDLIDGIATVEDTLLQEDGSYLIHYQAIGFDSAFRHDYIDANVVNGRVYYYSVTAFDYQPMYFVNGIPANTETHITIPRTIETPMKTKTNFKSVVPQKQIAGYSYDAMIQSSNQVEGFNEYYHPYGKAIQTRIVDASKIKDRTLLVQFYTIPDSFNHEPLRGFASGTLAYRFVDSATGEILRIDYRTRDNPLTFIDSNQNGVLDVSSQGVIIPSSGDKIYDDSYFSTAIARRSLDGVVLTPYQSFPVVDGIEYMPYEMQKGVVDIVQNTDGSTVLPTPRSVLNSPSVNGRWQIQIADILKYVPFYITDLTRALRMMDSTFNSAGKDYEIRFSAAGDSGYTRPTSRPLPTASGNVKIRLPFSIINIGKTLNGVNNVSDDTTLYAKISDFNLPVNITGWGYDTGDTNFGYTNMVSAVRNPVYTTPLPATVAASPPSTVAFTGLVFKAMIGVNDTAAFKANPSAWLPSNGTIITILTAKPYNENDVFKFNTNAHTAYSKSKAKDDLDDIRVVPNPYYGSASAYQKDIFDKKIKFMNLPGNATIYIFDIAGNVIRILKHNSTSRNDRVNDNPDSTTVKPASMFTGIEIWDLKNKRGQYVASGMYIALVDAKGIGQKLLKFAVVQEKYITK